MNAKKPEKILIATGNAGKVREFAELLKDLPIEILGLKHFPEIEEVEETGATFEENAKLKAAGYAVQTGFWTLADDSGLEVEALENAPGVFSARYAGKTASYREKMEKLLAELKKTGDRERKARFVCAIALAAPDGEIVHLESGTCEGQISDKPRGSNGFGYDPVFVPDNFQKTFGELPENIKQEISHRGRATRKIIRFLRDFFKISLDHAVLTE
ncbi:MAG: XTP/dITP diphosphatase [Acidobacteriota bacterium]|nr:XTP/dITP diphosphatase [Acidobacteriota bacterium]